MKLFWEKMADLLKVKTLVTFSVVTVFTVLALKGKIQPDNVMIVVSMVVSFYFGTQHEKKALYRAIPPAHQSRGDFYLGS